MNTLYKNSPVFNYPGEAVSGSPEASESVSTGLAAIRPGASGARIEFIDVGKSYGSVHALRDFSLIIEEGEFLTILGASGSGKSTVLNALAGFAPADRGDIRVAGRSVAAEPPERRNLGMVFQNYSLFPHMTVFENVAFPLRMRRASRSEIDKQVTAALATVRLAEFGARMPRELSGGQQQRVAFARAIVFRPPVLIMDEPLGALDLKLREALQFEIKAIQHELGCTVVYVTHDQREALAMSSRIVILREGQIQQVGSPTDIYDRPASRFVAEFIGQTNLFSALIEQDGAVALEEIGVVLHRSTDELRAGRWAASIRPEKLQRRAAEKGDISIRVEIQEAVFLGDIVEFSARHQGGALVHFREQRLDHKPIAHRAETIDLVFRPDDVVVVPEI